MLGENREAANHHEMVAASLIIAKVSLTGRWGRTTLKQIINQPD